MSSDLLLYEFPESCTATLPRTDVDYHLISRSPCIDTGQDRSADGFTDDIEGGVRGTDGEEAEEMAVTGIWALTNMVLPRQGGYRNHGYIFNPHKKIEAAILNFWEMYLPKAIFVQVRIYRKKYPPRA